MYLVRRGRIKTTPSVTTVNTSSRYCATLRDHGSTLARRSRNRSRASATIWTRRRGTTCRRGYGRYNNLYSNYSGTSPYGHLTSMVTSPLRSPLISPKLYSTVQFVTPCNMVTSPLRSHLGSPMGDRIREVPLYL